MAVNIQGAEVVIEAGFGFGALETVTTWTDITADMRAVGWSRGRLFELDRVEAGSGSILLNNRHGDYTPENTAGSYYPDVDLATPIRVSAIYNSITYRLFYGKWEDIPLTFPGNVDATVEVPFSDVFEVLAGALTPTTFPESVLALTPRAYWRLGDTADSGPEGDHTLTLTGSPTQGEAGPWSANEATLFNGSTQYATAADGADDLNIRGDLTIVAWVNCDAPTGLADEILSRVSFFDKVYAFGITSGGLYYSHVSVSTLYQSVLGSIDADTWYFVAVTRDVSANRVVFYIDGATVGSATVDCSDIATTTADTTISSSLAPFDGHIAEVALFDKVLTGDEMAGLYSAQADPYPTQRTDERIAALAADAGVTDTDLEVGQSSMAATSAPGGSSILEEMGKASDTEAGVLFVAGDGALTFHDRHYRIDHSLTVQATLGRTDDATYQDIEAGRYVANVFNEIVVTPGDTAIPVRVSDDTSQTKYGVRSRPITTYPANTGEATDHASYVLAQYKAPGVRVRRVKFVMGVDTAAWPIVLGAEIGDRFTIKKAMAGDDLNQDVYLEAITHEITAQKTWVVFWDLSPAEFVTGFWLLDSSTRSQLDSTTTLNF